MRYAIERRNGKIEREIRRLIDSIAKGIPVDHRRLQIPRLTPAPR